MWKTILPYMKIARFDHWFKNVFMLPGIVLAFFARPDLFSFKTLIMVVIAFLAAGMVASSNYVLNELLDAKFDALHPVKRHRPVPSGLINKPLAFGQWILFAYIGLAIAWSLGPKFFWVALWLWGMGCIYNIPPVRSKDKPYLDVLSESVNNPIRLLMGWYATGISVVPPVSLIVAYWMVGAFFMAIKRFAEYRRINDPVVSAAYRRSFAFYNEERLLISIVYYGVTFGLFFGIFLIRYRIELILSVPLIAGFIAWYFHLGFLEDSPAQYPEHLYRQKGFFFYCVICAITMIALLFISIPPLETFFQSTIQ